jgi:hypothetical protein
MTRYGYFLFMEEYDPASPVRLATQVLPQVRGA